MIHLYSAVSEPREIIKTMVSKQVDRDARIRIDIQLTSIERPYDVSESYVLDIRVYYPNEVDTVPVRTVSIKSTNQIEMVGQIAVLLKQYPNTFKINNNE